MNGNQTSEYQVKNLAIRQSPQISAGGQVQRTTILSFSVGSHGPFSVIFSDRTPTPADYLAAISEQVNQLKATVAAVAQLNSQSA